MEIMVDKVKNVVTCYGDYAVFLVSFIDPEGNYVANKKVWCCHKCLNFGDVISVVQTSENDYREVSPQGDIL